MKHFIVTLAVLLSSAMGYAQEAKKGFQDATLLNMEGKSVALSQYVGKHKYVLVDFWASWCGPCMNEMPNVKAAYAKYKSRGLEIVGISLDRDKNAWEGAVSRLGMTWPQLTELGVTGTKASALYKVQYIPHTLIFDNKGNIVAENPHGEEMLSKLEELMPGK